METTENEKEEFIRVGTTLYKLVNQPCLNGGYVKKRIPWNNETYEVFAEWSGSIRRFNYILGIQGQHVSYSQNKDKIREWNIEPQLRLTYDATDKLSFSFNGNSNMFGSGLGKSSSIVYQDDKFQYIAGNSELKPEKTYYGAFSSTLFTKKYFGDIEFSYERRNSPLKIGRAHV